MATAARLSALVDDLQAGRSIAGDDARLVARAVRKFLEKSSQERKELLCQEARRERDENLVASRAIISGALKSVFHWR